MWLRVECSTYKNPTESTLDSFYNFDKNIMMNAY